MKESPMDFVTFVRSVLGKTPYPYQIEVAEAILKSHLERQGHIFTVMIARQGGKNEISAWIEAYLLYTHSEGTIIKAAPTFHPQIRNSFERLHLLLYTSELRERLWSNASMIGLAPMGGTEREKKQAGPRVNFYSASPESNVVGSTASLLLEIDEAQDVEFAKFNRDFRPMAAVKNATTVLYGTAWSDDTLLARQRAANLNAQERTGMRTHFEYDWRCVAERNQEYRVFVEREIERLGEKHPIIQTQYCLRSIDGAGYLLNALQRNLLQGKHTWLEEPEEDGWYVAGMDVGGEYRPDPHSLSSSVLWTPPGGHDRHDSSVFTLARVRYNELSLPCLEIVHQHCWTGKSHMDQYMAVKELMEQWNVRTLLIDSTGLGEGLASLLVKKFGFGRVRPFHFSQPSKSHLTYQFLDLINGGRLTMPTPDSMPAHIYQICWEQLRLARYRLPAPDVISMHIDPAEGHDDFLISVALLGEALNDLMQPVASASVPPRRYYTDEGPY
jgi:hypothetical protein